MMKNKRIKKILYCLLFAAVLSIKLASAQAEPVIIDRIVASVEGSGVITNVQLVQYTAVSAVLESGYSKAVQDMENPGYMKSSLDRLIDRMLMLKDAQLLSIRPPDQGAVNTMISRFRSEFKSEGDYRDYMKQYVLTQDYLKKYMIDSLTVQQYLNDEIQMLVKVSSADIEQYYENNREAYRGMTKQDAEKDIHALLKQKEYNQQLKSWIKTLMLHREIIIMY
jgi:hypothetical protein